MNKYDMIEDEIKTLYEKGSALHCKISEGDKGVLRSDINFEYQLWYTTAIPIIRQLIPERLEEFNTLYKHSKRDEKNITSSLYSISDYLGGVIIKHGNDEAFDSKKIFLHRFMQQLAIFRSIELRLKSVLSDISGVLQSELFDNEIDAAKELLSKGHLRAAGTLAGVTLERHLLNITNQHQLIIKKKNPCISDLNDTLKDHSIIDVPSWRHIQFLGDIRNLCTHNKDREPSKEEVNDMITGVEKIIKSVF